MILISHNSFLDFCLAQWFVLTINFLCQILLKDVEYIQIPTSFVTIIMFHPGSKKEIH